MATQPFIQAGISTDDLMQDPDFVSAPPVERFAYLQSQVSSIDPDFAAAAPDDRYSYLMSQYADAIGIPNQPQPTMGQQVANTLRPVSNIVPHQIQDFTAGIAGGLAEKGGFITQPIESLLGTGVERFQPHDHPLAENPAFQAGSFGGSLAGTFGLGTLASMAAGPYAGFGALSGNENLQRLMGGEQNLGQATFNTALDTATAGLGSNVGGLLRRAGVDAAIGGAGSGVGYLGNQVLTGQSIEPMALAQQIAIGAGTGGAIGAATHVAGSGVQPKPKTYREPTSRPIGLNELNRLEGRIAYDEPSQPLTQFDLPQRGLSQGQIVPSEPQSIQKVRAEQRGQRERQRREQERGQTDGFLRFIDSLSPKKRKVVLDKIQRGASDPSNPNHRLFKEFHAAVEVRAQFAERNQNRERVQSARIQQAVQDLTRPGGQPQSERKRVLETLRKNIVERYEKEQAQARTRQQSEDSGKQILNAVVEASASAKPTAGTAKELKAPGPDRYSQMAKNAGIKATPVKKGVSKSNTEPRQESASARNKRVFDETTTLVQSAIEPGSPTGEMPATDFFSNWFKVERVGRSNDYRIDFGYGYGKVTFKGKRSVSGLISQLKGISKENKAPDPVRMLAGKVVRDPQGSETINRYLQENVREVGHGENYAEAQQVLEKQANQQAQVREDIYTKHLQEIEKDFNAALNAVEQAKTQKDLTDAVGRVYSERFNELPESEFKKAGHKIKAAEAKIERLAKSPTEEPSAEKASVRKSSAEYHKPSGQQKEGRAQSLQKVLSMPEGKQAFASLSKEVQTAVTEVQKGIQKNKKVLLSFYTAKGKVVAGERIAEKRADFEQELYSPIGMRASTPKGADAPNLYIDGYNERGEFSTRLAQEIRGTAKVTTHDAYNGVYRNPLFAVKQFNPADAVYERVMNPILKKVSLKQRVEDQDFKNAADELTSISDELLEFGKSREAVNKIRLKALEKMPADVRKKVHKYKYKEDC